MEAHLIFAGMFCLWQAQGLAAWIFGADGIWSGSCHGLKVLVKRGPGLV